MRKIWLGTLLVLMLLGCSGGSSSDGSIAFTQPSEEVSDTNTTDANTTDPIEPPLEEPPAVERSSIIDEPYITEQWSIYENFRFYRRNGVSTGASINSGSVLESSRGRGIKIAIIDDGLDIDHEDLEGAVVSSFDLETQTSDVSHIASGDLHGTAVAGIVAARVNRRGIAGVASEADIIFLKFKPLMSDSDFIELFDRAANMGADVINNSWGTGSASPAFREKIADLATNGRGGRGISIVFAAGNDAISIDGDESSIPEVISVGATNKDGVVTGYSNFGTNLDIVAPGGEYLGISTLDPSGFAGGSAGDYLLYNDSNGFVGTSAAAPIVSGIIALMLEKNPDLTRVEIESILKRTADKVGGVFYDTDGHNDYYGHGKVNLLNIMNEL